MADERPKLPRPKVSATELAKVTREDLARYLVEVARQEPEIANLLLAEPAPAERTSRRVGRRVARP